MTPLEQGKAFWDDMTIKTKFQPHSIMFMVDHNCPIYFTDYKEWVVYFCEAWPSNTYSYFVTEGKESLNINLAALKFMRFFRDCKEIIEDAAMWDEHNGVTTA